MKQHPPHKIIQIHCVISGRVQGVGFRYFSNSTAKRYQLDGWVRNLSNGKVETVVQGNASSVNNFVEDIQNGNGLSKIDHIEIREQDVQHNLCGFEILDTKKAPM